MPVLTSPYRWDVGVSQRQQRPSLCSAAARPATHPATLPQALSALPLPRSRCQPCLCQLAQPQPPEGFPAQPYSQAAWHAAAVPQPVACLLFACPAFPHPRHAVLCCFCSLMVCVALFIDKPDHVPRRAPPIPHSIHSSFPHEGRQQAVA